MSIATARAALRRALSPASVGALGAALACGAATTLGRPGFDLWPAYFLGQWWLALQAVRSRSWGTLLVTATAWGLALGIGVGIGGASWGVLVPTGVALTIWFVLAVPQAFLVRWAVARGASPALHFVLIASAWSLWLSLWDRLGVLCRAEASPLLGIAPQLFRGASIVGACVLCGIALGGVTTSALQWARSDGAPRGYRLRLALQPVAVAVAALLGLGALAKATAPVEVRALKVGIPQIDADAVYYQSRMTYPPIVEAFDRRLAELLQQLAPADLVVFTETYDGRYGLMLPSERARLAARARHRAQAHLVTSYLAEPDGRKSNALGAFSRSGELVGIHRKVALAPYGERTLAAGSKAEPLDLGDGTIVGALICNEAGQSDISLRLVEQGANLLAASTSDISFGSSVLSFEHLMAARFQAVELGRDIVWASNGGPSGILTRAGRAESVGPFRAPAAVLGTARLYSDLTPYARGRSTWLVLAALVLGAAWFATRHARAASAPRPTAKPPDSVRLAPLAILGGAVLACAAPVLQPMVVESLHGDPARAPSAIADLFRDKPSLSELGIASAAAAPIDSASAAMALLAAYYGAPHTGATPGAPTSLEQIKQRLETDFDLATKTLDLRHGPLPRVATIVQLREGDFAIFTRPEGDRIDLYRPSTQTPERINPAELLRRSTGLAVLPVSRL